MRYTAEQFRKEKNKRLTLLGMSGVGKTHLSKLLAKEGGWFHYSGDFRIGASHLKNNIIDNIANKMKVDPWLKGPLVFPPGAGRYFWEISEFPGCPPVYVKALCSQGLARISGNLWNFWDF